MKITNVCTQKNKVEKANLSKEQKKGLKSLQKKQNEGKIVVFQTDKSGKMSVDTPKNYAEATKPHMENDTIIDQTELKKI